MELPNLGDVFEGRYELISLLGEGGFARVFRARDAAVGREVAIKVLSPQGGEYSTLTGARFLRECRMIANLQDPHTITMYDFGESPTGLLYMVSEFVPGVDLRTTLQRQERLSPRVVVRILQQLLEALREAHTNGIFHRDVKPANVLVYSRDDDPYCVKLLDFGLARPVDVDATQLTGAGRTVGTPRYMSPEQVFAAELGPRSDLYSLGLVAYEMLTGEPAVDGPTMKALLQAHVTGPPVVVPQALAPPRLRAVIEKMCVRELAERYGSADEVLRDLALARAELRDPTGGVPVASPAAPQGDHEARSWTLGVLAVAFGFVALIVIAAIWPTEPLDDVTPSKPTAPEVPSALLQTAPAIASETSGSEPVEPDVGATAQVAAGCEIGEPGLREIEFMDGLTARRVLVYFPERFDPDRTHALIAVLREGGSFTRQTYLEYVGLGEIADREQAILVLPEAKRGLDNFGRSWGPSTRSTAWDEIRGVATRYCTDDIFVFGEGSGAAAVDNFVCEYGARITAAATSAHRYRAEERPCLPQHPVPYLKFVHTKIKVCNDRAQMPLAKQEKLLRDSRECRDRRQREFSHELGVCESFDCEVPYWRCEVDGGRGWGPWKWPDRYVDCMGPAVDFPHREALWKFFAAHATTP